MKKTHRIYKLNTQDTRKTWYHTQRKHTKWTHNQHNANMVKIKHKHKVSMLKRIGVNKVKRPKS